MHLVSILCSLSPSLYFLHRPTLAEISIITPFLHILQRIGPPSFRRLVVTMVPIPAVQRFKTIIDVMYSTAIEIFEEKKNTVSKVVSESTGDDFMEELKDVMSLTCEVCIALLRVERLEH